MDSLSQSTRRPAPVDWARRLLIAGLFALFAAASVLLAVRRAVGALEQPLDGGTLVLSFLLAVSVIALFRHHLPLGTQTWFSPMVWGPLALLGLLAWSLCLPGSSQAAVAVACGLIAVEEGHALRRLLGRRNPPRTPLGHAVVKHGEVVDLPTAASQPVAAPDASAGQLVQQFVRRRLSDGRERMDGAVVVSFAAGQRTAWSHIAFCPPWDATPKLTMEEVSGPSARVKVDQLLPYGARLHLKLADAPRLATTVQVTFVAEASPHVSHVADAANAGN